MNYIVKKRHAISTTKGIVGPPVDPENPTEKEFITSKHFKNGQTGLQRLLQHKKCPIIVFEPKKEKEKEKSGEDVTVKDSQRPEKENEKSKGAVKK